jgi:glycopeptide antibiotics resistance protein
LGIELYQLMDNFIVTGFKFGESQRAVDIDDVILNTLGALIGILIFIVYKSRKILIRF